MRREADDTGPYAEFEHWRLLNARFNSVLEQIRSHDCSMAIQILHISKSKILKVPAAYLATQGRPQDFFQGRAIGGGRDQWLGGTMASAEHEPITGVWGQSPQRGPGIEPLVRGSGGQSGQSFLEAESISVIGCPTEPALIH